MTRLDNDRLYDRLAALVDEAAPEERARALARAVIALVAQHGDGSRVTTALGAAEAAGARRLRAPASRGAPPGTAS